MSRSWRHAVIGVGVVGEWHVRTIPHVEGSQLVAACDINPDNARPNLEKNRRADLPLYTDIREMLRKEQVDVAHVCTPSGDHLEPALACMEAGVNVIVEKPLEIRLDRIDRMIETARQRNVKLAGIFQNRWNRAHRTLFDAARAGRFGRVAFAGCSTPWYRSDEYYRKGGWRGSWALDGGGAIMNQSVHGVDLLQWIVGPVNVVSAHACSRIHAEIEVEDTLVCSLVFENGTLGTIMGSTAMWPGSAVRLEIGGEFGTAVSESGLKTFRFQPPRDEDQQLLDALGPGWQRSTGGGANPQDVPQELHRQNIDAILRAWERGGEAETNGPEARKAVAIILAMYESARRGGVPVKVN